MHDYDPSRDPARIAFDTLAWEGVEDLAPALQLSEAHLTILRRIANGEGLFQVLDSQLRPTYDFGAVEPVDSATVEALLGMLAIEFQGAPGLSLPSRARLTALGQDLIAPR